MRLRRVKVPGEGEVLIELGKVTSRLAEIEFEVRDGRPSARRRAHTPPPSSPSQNKIEAAVQEALAVAALSLNNSESPAEAGTTDPGHNEPVSSGEAEQNAH